MLSNNDGYLAGRGCETRSEWIPKHSHFDQVSPYHWSAVTIAT